MPKPKKTKSPAHYPGAPASVEVGSKPLQIRMLGDNLLVRRHKPEAVRPSGLVLPDPPPSNYATVVAVGPGFVNAKGVREPLQTKVGDTVLMTKWGGAVIVLHGEELMILPERELLGIGIPD